MDRVMEDENYEVGRTKSLLIVTASAQMQWRQALVDQQGKWWNVAQHSMQEEIQGEAHG